MMDLGSMILIVLVSLIAIIATAGGIWALLKQQVVVDQTGNVTEIKIPVLGSFKTNYPSLGAVAMGVLLAFAVLYTSGIKPDTTPLIAKVLLEHPSDQLESDVFVGVIPQRYQARKANVRTAQETPIEITVDKARNYNVIVYTVTGYDPDTGYAEKVVAHGSPDANNVFDAKLRLQR